MDDFEAGTSLDEELFPIKDGIHFAMVFPTYVHRTPIMIVKIQVGKYGKDRRGRPIDVEKVMDTCSPYFGEQPEAFIHCSRIQENKFILCTTLHYTVISTELQILCQAMFTTIRSDIQQLVACEKLQASVVGQNDKLSIKMSVWVKFKTNAFHHSQ